MYCIPHISRQVATMRELGFSAEEVRSMAAHYSLSCCYSNLCNLCHLLKQGTPLPELVADPQRLGFDYSRRGAELTGVGFSAEEAARLSRSFPPFLKMEIGGTFAQLRSIGLNSLFCIVIIHLRFVFIY